MEKDAGLGMESSQGLHSFAEGDPSHLTDPPSDSKQRESSSDPQMLSVSSQPATESSPEQSALGKDVNVNCEIKGDASDTKTAVHTQPLTSHVCNESDTEEFVSASEGEEEEDDDDDDDDQKLEEWAESLSDFNITGNTQPSTEKDFASEGDLCSQGKSGEQSLAKDSANTLNAASAMTPEAYTEKLEEVMGMPSSSEMCQENVPQKDDHHKASAEDTSDIEQAIAAATVGSEENSEAGEEGEEEEDGEKTADEEKENSENKDGDEEDEEEESMEQELKRQEEEDQLSEKELQKRLSDAVEVKTRGNDAFKNGQYHDALQLYTEALELCPLKYIHQRALMLSNRAACQNREGYYQRAIKDSSKAIKLDPAYIKAYFRRADAQEKLEKLDEALKDHQKIVELDRSQVVSYQACLRLEKEIQERNEKMKTEMLGKLKDLGNMVLRPFGLSTNNFQLQQDPGTGSYSVQFVQQAPTNGH